MVSEPLGPLQPRTRHTHFEAYSHLKSSVIIDLILVQVASWLRVSFSSPSVSSLLGPCLQFASCWLKSSAVFSDCLIFQAPSCRPLAPHGFER